MELNSQCQAKLREKVLAQGGWSPLECEDPSHYTCALKVYRPEIENATFKDNLCLDWNGQSTCLEIDISTHNTSPLLASGSFAEDEFFEGGKFYRQEYRCLQNNIQEGGKPLIIEVGDSLEQALSLARATCYQGVQK